MKFSQRLEYLFFPWDVSCVACRAEETEPCGLCRRCQKELTPLSGTARCEICLDPVAAPGLCAACLQKAPAYERLYASYVFTGLMRRLILDFKFHNKRYLKRTFARMAAETIPESVLASCACLIPVPISRTRKRERGFNQAALLAGEIACLTGLPVREDVLMRKDGKTQTALLSKEERRKSISGLYTAAVSLHGETVLLVDDICTTGETLRACADALKHAGAGKIYCYTVARTDRK